ncbi:hypothetical protein C1646_815491 [Rhizophagus diaphanus]|nr:hypothetical protein C1646_815491 [Rhizophagus diaphanus] [Rhizophagus sp. MUCL 43196]
MYRYPVSNKLELSLNCLVLGQTLSECFCVDIGEKNLSDNEIEVKFTNFIVSHLKEKLFRETKIKNLIQDKNQMDIYKGDSKKVNDETNNLKKFIKDDIKNKLNGELLTPMRKLTSCFNTKVMDKEGINIFIVLTPTGKVSPNVLPLEEEQNINFDLTSFFSRVKAGPSRGVAQGPDWHDASSIYEWIQKFTLNRGNNRLVKTYGKNFELYQREDTIETLWNLIKERYPNRNDAGGPGTEKSRFLDEIKRLLEHCINKSDEEIRNGFANMVVISTTYGNGSPANSFDIRIIVIYADFIKQRKQETSSCPPLVLVLGIDEFNNLHDIQKKVCKDLINSIGGAMCKSPENIFFIPILVGTIEEAISDYINQFSSHYAYLIMMMQLALHPYFRIGISDVGGHVRTLEYYYSNFAKQEDDKMKLATETETGETGLYDVNIGKVVEFVKHKIVNKYQINRYSSHLSVPLAKAMLGLSVRLINLVSAGASYLIRLPYLWVCAIVEYSTDPDLSNWKSMLQYDDPINWQNFKDFNAKFLALRLSLFRLLGYEKINLKEFLKGADFSHSFPDVEVALPETRNIKLYKLLHRYPVAKTYKNQEAKYVNLTEMRNGYFDLDLLQNDDIKKYTGCVFFNAAGAPWNVFGLLKYDPYKETFLELEKKAGFLNHLKLFFLYIDSFDYTKMRRLLPKLNNIKTLKIDEFSFINECTSKTLVYNDLEILNIDYITIGETSIIIENSGGHLKEISLKPHDFIYFQEYFKEILENRKEILKILIKSAPTNLREIRFFNDFNLSLEVLEEFLEKWRDRPALSIQSYL